ncbi:MAG: hypothetical protein GKC10_01370 [Methanosarcinales archaeon]|nr:hypothetical protein [Methanosarcinales archaeon]
MVALISVLLMLILISGASGRCTFGTCGAGSTSWEKDALEFMNSDIPQLNGTDSSFPLAGGMLTPRPFPNPGIIQPLIGFSSSGLVVDAALDRQAGQPRARGALHLPWNGFLNENESLRPLPELAAILGAAGISAQESVSVYGDSLSQATFVYWVLSYLGHEEARVLDGTFQDYATASLPMDREWLTRPAVEYRANPRPELLAEYGMVKNGSAQIVDARDFQDFGHSRIPGAIFVGSSQVVEGTRIKDQSSLKEAFAGLDQNRTVVVYGDLAEASVVWYALQLMGYDSRLYPWDDWQDRENGKRDGW